MHAAAYYVEHHSKLDAVSTVLTVAIPVGIYTLVVYVLYMLLTGTQTVFNVLLLALTAAVLVVAVILVGRGMSMANALLIVMLAPAVSVVGYEVRGYRHADRAVAARLGDGESGKTPT